MPRLVPSLAMTLYRFGLDMKKPWMYAMLNFTSEGVRLGLDMKIARMCGVVLCCQSGAVVVLT